WRDLAPRLGELEVLEGGDDHPGRAVKRRVRLLSRDEGDFVTVVIPEVLVSKSWIQFLRRRRALFLKSALLFEPGVVVTDVPLVPEERERSAGSHAEHPSDARRGALFHGRPGGGRGRGGRMARAGDGRAARDGGGAVPRSGHPAPGRDPEA